MRTFLTLWTGQTLSSLGTRITGFALTLWIFEQTGKATSLALVGISFGLAAILVNLFAGVIVDRFSRKRLIWLTDTLAGLITLVYLFLFLRGELALWHIYVGSALRGGLDIIQRLAFNASLSLMVPKEHYVRTSGLQTFTHYAGNIVGPGLGAVLYTTIGVGGVMVVDIATFVVAVVIVFLNQIPQPAVQGKAAVARQVALFDRVRASMQRFAADVTLGIRHIAGRPGLRALMIVVALADFFDGPPNALLGPLVLARTNNDATALAAAGIASGIGGVTMSVLLGIWGGPRRKQVRAVLLSILGAGLAKCGVGLSRGVAGWSFYSGAASFTFPMRGGADRAIWLAKVDPGLQGRVQAATSGLQQLAFYIAFASAAPLADYVFEPALAEGGALVPYLGGLFPTGPGAGFAFVIFLAAAGMALVGLGGFLVPALRHLEENEADIIINN